MLVKNPQEFHRIVCKRDGYICQKCKKDFSYDYYFNEIGDNVYVCGHHVKSKGSRPDLKLETDDGECICFECHELEHRGLSKKL